MSEPHRFRGGPLYWEWRCLDCDMPHGFWTHQPWWRRLAWRWGFLIPKEHPHG